MTEDVLFHDLFQSFIGQTIGGKKLYDTITEISKSSEAPYDSAVEDDINEIFSMDAFSLQANRIINSTNGNIKRHSSVDGFYYLKKESKILLFFIEFKRIHRYPGNNYSNLLKNEIKPSLMLKSLESLNCVLPHLISQNCSDENTVKLLDMIHKSTKYYICVINNPNVSNANAHNIVTSDYMDLKRLEPYPFKNVLPMSNKKFEEFFQRLIDESN